MNDDKKQLLASKKFWTTIIGLFATLGTFVLAKWGLQVDDQQVNLIAGSVAGLFGMLLLGQGLTDQGKEAAKVKNGQSGFASLAFIVGFLMCLGLVFSLVVQAGCDGMKGRGAAAAKAFVDCGKAEIRSQVDELKPALEQNVRNVLAGDGKIDRPAFSSFASPLKSAGARCALDAAIAALLNPPAPLPGAPQSEPLAVDRADLADAYNGVRAGAWGGVELKPASSP